VRGDSHPRTDNPKPCVIAGTGARSRQRPQSAGSHLPGNRQPTAPTRPGVQIRSRRLARNSLVHRVAGHVRVPRLRCCLASHQGSTAPGPGEVNRTSERHTSARRTNKARAPAFPYPLRVRESADRGTVRTFRHEDRATHPTPSSNLSSRTHGVSSITQRGGRCAHGQAPHAKPSFGTVTSTLDELWFPRASTGPAEQRGPQVRPVSGDVAESSPSHATPRARAGEPRPLQVPPGTGRPVATPPSDGSGLRLSPHSLRPSRQRMRAWAGEESGAHRRATPGRRPSDPTPNPLATPAYHELPERHPRESIDRPGSGVAASRLAREPRSNRAGPGLQRQTASNAVRRIA